MSETPLDLNYIEIFVVIRCHSFLKITHLTGIGTFAQQDNTWTHTKILTIHFLYTNSLSHTLFFLYSRTSFAIQTLYSILLIYSYSYDIATLFRLLCPISR